MIASVSGALLAGALVSTSSTVRLHLDACVPDRDLVHDLVGIEIGFDRMTEEVATFEVYGACSPGELDLSLDTGGGAQERRILLGDVRVGGPRLVALHIVELIHDAAARPRPPPPLPSSSPVVQTGTEASTFTRLGAAPTLRLLPKPGRVAIGGRASIGVDLPVGRRTAVAILIDAGFEQADANVPLGTVRTRVLSAAGMAGGRFDLIDDFALFVLAGLRGGWGWLEGVSEDAEQVEIGAGNGPWLGAAVGLRGRYGGAIGVTLGLEGGWTVYRLFGDAGASEPVGLQSGWVGVDVTVDWSFGGS